MTTILYSRESAAEATTLSPDEIDRAIKSGELRAKRRGRRVLILHADLEKFAESLEDA